MTTIRAGKLDRLITVLRERETVAESGAVSKVWAPVATVRAEMVLRRAEEYLTGFGEADTGSVVFRIRYNTEITVSDRVTFDGASYDIEEIAELGRRRGLELHCTVVPA